MPGPLAVAVTVKGTALPLSCPDALPAIVRPPPQTAVNVPAIDVAVCVEIWYLKLPHVVGLGRTGRAFDSHRPTSEVAVEPAVAPGVGAADAAGDGVGPAMLVACSKAHPMPDNDDTSPTISAKVLVIFITSSGRRVRFCRPGVQKTSKTGQNGTVEVVKCRWLANRPSTRCRPFELPDFARL